MTRWATTLLLLTAPVPAGGQLVPGLGWAVGGGVERGASGPLAYLSLEHRFR